MCYSSSVSLIGGIVCEGGEGRKKEEGGRGRAELGGDGRRIYKSLNLTTYVNILKSNNVSLHSFLFKVY